MFRRASSNEWRTLVASALGQMGIACWEYDLATGELWWSDNAGPLTGRPIGFTPGDFDEAERLFMPAEDRPHGERSVAEASRSGPIEVERKAILPDGSTRWTYHRYFLMVDDDAQPKRLAGVMMDIDARKRRQQEDAVLIEASRALAESLDESQILKTIPQLLVPEIADWCVLDLMEDGVLKPLAATHTDPSKVRWAEAIRSEYPPDLDSPTGIAEVIRSGKPELHPHISDEMLAAAARDDRHLELLQSAGIRSAMVIPLRSRNEVIGAATLVMAESHRLFDEQSLGLAERLFGHIATSIDNARLHRQVKEAWKNERLAVDTLQRGLAPPPLPSVDGLDLAGHYEIGGSEKIGGDWYEVFENEKGEIVFVVGDVAGRGIQAVNAMSQFRNGLRVLLMEGHSPSAALGLLHRLTHAKHVNGTDFATAGCLIYRPESHDLIWSAAGHPPAMVLHPKGRVERLWQKPDPPLGVGSGDYSTAQMTVTPGMLLVLYTDGLIERRSESIDVSLDRLGRELESCPMEPEQAVAHLLKRLPSYPSTDDVAVLVARFDDSSTRLMKTSRRA